MTRRVALFLPELEAGGGQKVMLSLARSFAERDLRVDLVVSRAEGALLSEVPPQVRLVELGAGLRRFGVLGLALSSLSRFAGYLRRDRPEALLCTLTGANLVAVMARRLSGVPMRLILREAVSLANQQGVRLFLMRHFYPAADCIIALTETMRRELIERTGLPSDKVFTIPNPVDVDYIRQGGARGWSIPGLTWQPVSR